MADDQAAFVRLSDWLNAAPGRTAVLTGQYRIGRRPRPQQGVWAVEGALTIRRPRNVRVLFNGAQILMDNLDQRGGGDQFHGIFVEGPGDGLTLDSPVVRWMRPPARRSAGDGIRLHGYPSDAGALRNVSIRNSQTFSAPQAGLIMTGCAEVAIDHHLAQDTLADGFHVNASRRVRAMKVEGLNTGDDACAFVTYFSPRLAGIYGHDDVDPFGQPDYGRYCNTDCYVGTVVARGGRASGLRLAQCNGVVVDVVDVSMKEQAFIADGGMSGGGYGWPCLQPIGCRIGSVRADRCVFGLHARSFNNVFAGGAQADDPRLFTMDVQVGRVQAIDCRQSMDVRNIRGLRIGSSRLQGGGVSILHVEQCDFGDVSIVDSSLSHISRSAKALFKRLSTSNAIVEYI